MPHSGKFFETMVTLQPHLKKQQLDELVQKSEFISEDLRKKYAHLTDLIVRSPVVDEVETMAAKGDTQYRKDEQGNFILGDEESQQT